jgi:AmiR/NasT family two-component response regulator
MTGSSNSSQLSPRDLIEQARAIIMNRFDLDAAQALKVLRRMSQDTKTQMCVVAEHLINYNDPMEALRRLEEDALLRLTPETKR